MKSVENAMQKVDRKGFVPEYLRDQSDIDAPLPIGSGQTISQPSTVKQMLEWLDAKSGDKVLDIGSGSGWTTALLSKIVGKNGKVHAVEIIPDLVKFGENNCLDAGVTNAVFHLAGKKYGLPDESPFDRILVSAAAQKIPNELLKQLKVGGKMVMPINNDILEIEKQSDTKYLETAHPGFIFVPLIDNS